MHFGDRRLGSIVRTDDAVDNPFHALSIGRVRGARDILLEFRPILGERPHQTPIEFRIRIQTRRVLRERREFLGKVSARQGIGDQPLNNRDGNGPKHRGTRRAARADFSRRARTRQRDQKKPHQSAKRNHAPIVVRAAFPRLGQKGRNFFAKGPPGFWVFWPRALRLRRLGDRREFEQEPRAALLDLGKKIVARRTDLPGVRIVQRFLTLL